MGAWTRHMTDLRAFRNETGHCHVPLNHMRYPKLGLWVKEQRRHYTLLKQGRQSHMTLERVTELNKVGFCWDTHEATWLERLRELADFKEAHGTTAVPTNYMESPKLGTWVHHQRRQYKKFREGKPCHITAERIQALDRLDFVWYPRDKPSDDSSESGKFSWRRGLSTNQASTKYCLAKASEMTFMTLITKHNANTNAYGKNKNIFAYLKRQREDMSRLRAAEC